MDLILSFTECPLLNGSSDYGMFVRPHLEMAMNPRAFPRHCFLGNMALSKNTASWPLPFFLQCMHLPQSSVDKSWNSYSRVILSH